MNGTQEYIKQITEVCGQQSLFQSSNNLSASPVANAFASSHFAPFRRIFLNRVERLLKAYEEQEKNREVIIKLLKKILSERNWEGAFAELSAYDYLNFREARLLNPVILDKTPDTPTLARYLGKQANLDCYFGDFNVYMDVKVLADNAKHLLEGIYRDLRKELGRSDFHVTEDRDLALDPELIKHHRRKLLGELISEFKASNKPTIMRSKAIPQIMFRFHWEPGVHVSIGFYNPYRHAEAHYKLAFNYPEKYVENKPFLLMYVIFPWFNGIINRFDNGNSCYAGASCSFSLTNSACAAFNAAR